MSSGQTSDQGKLKKLGDRSRMLRQFEIDDLKNVMSTESGRALYYRVVFELSAIESASWCPAIKEGQSAAMHQSYLEGRKSIGRQMLIEAQQNFPEHWRDMINERLAKEAADTLARENIQQSVGESDYE